MCSVCKRQLKCNVASSSYTNLYCHLKLKLPGFAGIYAEAIGQNSKSAPLDAWFDPKATNIFNSVEWLIMDEHEFTFVESQLTRHCLKLAVDQFLKANVSEVISKVAAVMVELRALQAVVMANAGSYPSPYKRHMQSSR
ncbi:hypothetical protein H257_18803 [Aphanomyces astaci]|uniref:BED-type domain-containing protein n=1 Tax=Aphanomyces astaci TaxID=112090 RepID=W4FBU7_APHAT|nr:hypothetical protein H257_18803 [Aphanomyces astaci]ETV64286.1 hypothetical protein H257_18803 [Aphanomyces astaci]|eukprot:XP_009846231.1 hypothetical protein H257_18803 [Aphanomyces astaci]